MTSHDQNGARSNARRHGGRRWPLRVVVPLLATALIVPSTRHASAQEVTPERVDAALTQLETLAQRTIEANGVPGMSIAVVYQDQVVYLRGFGVREAGRPEPVDADVVFQLASMSKPIASTIAAVIVSEGAVAWDDAVITYDPGFRMHDAWVTSQVTIRDFFAHRSGLPGSAGNDLEEVGYDRDDILYRLRYLEPASSFRSTYAYSNFGLTEGAVAAAKAVGLSWEDAAAEKLYRPLGMSSTSSRYADFAASPNRAHLHVLDDGVWTPALTRNADAQSPAGGVSSSARDLAQWLRLQLGGGTIDGRQLIDADALAQTHLPEIVRGTNLVTGGPGFYGLGWDVDYDAQGRVFLDHAGAFSQGTQTQVKLLPEEDLGIVVLSNAFPTGVPAGIADSFFDLVLNGSLTRDWIAFWSKPYHELVENLASIGVPYATPPERPSPALPLSAYAGTYTNDYFGDIEIVAQDGALSLLIGPHDEPFPLEHFDRDIFTQVAFPEPPAPRAGVFFSVGPDRAAQEVVLEVYNADRQGTFTRVPPASMN